MRTFLIGTVVLTAAAALAACGSSDSTGPGTARVGGNWTFQEVLASSSLGVSCADTAQMTLSQTGQVVTGNYAQVGTCTAGGQVFDNSGNGVISGGQVVGDSIRFDEDFCEYRGTLTGTPATSMAGTVNCIDTTTSPPDTIPGSWTMTR